MTSQPINIGVFFKHEPTGGGIYQYFLSIMEALISLNPKSGLFLYHAHRMDRLRTYRTAGVSTVFLSHEGSGNTHLPQTASVYQDIFEGRSISFRQPCLGNKLKDAAEKDGIHLMIYVTPERESFKIGVPYITAFHDSAHKLLPQFDEFSANHVFEQREYVYTQTLKNARLILAESDTGKHQLETLWGIDSGKIEVLPFVPPPYLKNHPSDASRLFKNAHPPASYIFYPAQFWPHKNHLNLIKALHTIKQRWRKRIPMVFAGAKKDTAGGFDQVEALCRRLDIEEQVTSLGYVEDTAMAWLYTHASFLVMPTYLGPTNLPIIEAFALGCPVIASDIPGAREQVGDAGVLVDPDSPEDMATEIYKLWTNPTLRAQLAIKGRQKSASWTNCEFTQKLQSIVRRTMNMMNQNLN